jgi:uncharacterized OB-fold protein
MAVGQRTEFQGHFDRLSRGELAFPICQDCGKWHWYPMTLCPHCQSSRLAWRPVQGVGEIWSWTVVRHAFDPGYAGRLPYVVALVCFEDAPGVRLVANIEGVSPEDLRIGQPVRLLLPDDGRPLSRPVFGPLPTPARQR